MGQPAIRSGVSREEYLTLERASEVKHEYANGEMFAMSGCTREHSLLAANLLRELGNALLDRPCEVHTSDMRVKIAPTGRYVYPDVSVVCGQPSFEDAELDTLLNPGVVVEVLSESSEAYDRGDKFAQYQTVSSITDYVLVSQNTVRIEHFRRQPDGTWLLTILGPSGKLALHSIGAAVEIDRVNLKAPLARAASGG